MVKWGAHVSKGSSPLMSNALRAYMEAFPGAQTAQIFVMGPQSSHISVAASDRPKIKEIAASLSLYIHSAYINHLWSSRPQIRASSRNLIKRELEIGAEIGAKGLVVHISNQATPQEIGAALESLHLSAHLPPIYLENVWDTPYMNNYAEVSRLKELFHELPAAVRPHVNYCLDTSHLWASGLNVADPRIMRQYLEAIEPFHPLIHLNDNIHAQGSLKDKHDSLGAGKIWNESTASAKVIMEYGYPIIFERSSVGGDLKHELALIKDV